MKSMALLLLLAAMGGAALAQPAQSTGQEARNAERMRISAERAKLEAGFAAEETACHQKFFTNQCLNEIKPRRQEALADLRRQEISLDEEERKLKAAEQIRRTEEKSSAQKQQEAADRRAKAQQDYQSRLGRAAKKAEEQAKSGANVGKSKEAQDKAAAAADRQSAASEALKKFNERQDKAREHKADHERERLKQGKSTAKPLPVPP